MAEKELIFKKILIGFYFVILSCGNESEKVKNNCLQEDIYFFQINETSEIIAMEDFAFEVLITITGMSKHQAKAYYTSKGLPNEEYMWLRKFTRFYARFDYKEEKFMNRISELVKKVNQNERIEITQDDESYQLLYGLKKMGYCISFNKNGGTFIAYKK